MHEVRSTNPDVVRMLVFDRGEKPGPSAFIEREYRHNYDYEFMISTHPDGHVLLIYPFGRLTNLIYGTHLPVRTVPRPVV